MFLTCVLLLNLNSCVITKNAEVKYTQFPSRQVETTELYYATRKVFGDPSYDWDIYWSYFPFMIPGSVVIVGGDTVVAPFKILYGLGTYPFAKDKSASHKEEE